MNKILNTDQKEIGPDSFQEEHLKSVIPGVSHRKKLLNVENFDILITNQRLIFILASQAGGASNRYYKTAPGKILTENAANFEIKLDEIKWMKLTPGRSYNDCCGKRQEEKGQLEISAKKKYSFELPHLVLLKAQEVFKEAGLIK